jgi:hypothetical protein
MREVPGSNPIGDIVFFGDKIRSTSTLSIKSYSETDQLKHY